MKMTPSKNQKLNNVISDLQSSKKHQLDFEADDVLQDDLLQIKDLIQEINCPYTFEISLKKEKSIYSN
jgi:hypothetical protein